jgi:hypothetical protein
MGGTAIKDLAPATINGWCRRTYLIQQLSDTTKQLSDTTELLFSQQKCTDLSDTTIITDTTKLHTNIDH